MLYWKDDEQYDISHYEGELKNMELSFRNALYNYSNFNTEDALNEINILYYQNPNVQKIYAIRGMILCKLGKYEDSLHDLNKAIELKPTDYYSWSNRGILNLQIKNYDHSLTDCEESVRINNFYAEGLYNLACVKIRFERFDEALIHIENANNYKPANSTI